MFEIFLAGVFFFNRVKDQKNMDYLGQSIQESTKLILWKTAFKIFEGIWSA